MAVANSVGRSMIESQLNHAFTPFPTQRFASELFHFHAVLLLAASRVPFESYMAIDSESISRIDGFVAADFPPWPCSIPLSE